MTNTIVKHCIFVRALPATVWNQISSLRSWPAWNATMGSLEFKGPAMVGAQGRFYLASGPATPFEIVGLHAEKFIQLQSPLLWLGVTQEFRIVEITEGCVLTFEITLSGRAAQLSARLLKRVLAADTQTSMARLKACIEKQSADQQTQPPMVTWPKSPPKTPNAAKQA